MTIGPISTFLVSPYWENVDVGKVDQCSHVLIDKAQQFPGRGSGYARLITHPSVNSFKYQRTSLISVSAYEPFSRGEALACQPSKLSLEGRLKRVMQRQV